MTAPRDRQLLWLALAILVIDSVLLGLAISALRDPRVSFPLTPRSQASSAAHP
jgi:hypothetical protein